MEIRNMHLDIDDSKCTRCAACQQVCPTQAIKIRKDGYDFKPAYCISCCHCVAVCPQGALSNDSCPTEQMIDISDIPTLSPREAEIFLRRRRSIRCFKKQAVERDVLQQLLNVAHYAPTGSNSQSVGFLVADDKELLEQINEQLVCWMEYQIENKIPGYAYYKLFVRSWRQDHRDLILRGAPALVMSYGPIVQKRKADCATALSYLELYAPTMGLGTCWLGFIIRAIDDKWQPLLDLLNIPDEQEVLGAVLLGYPRYQYRLIPDRQPLKLHFCNE